MKRFLPALCCLLLFSSCTDDETDTLTPQQNKIISYLTSTHNPRLVAQSAAAPDNYDYYVALDDSTVFRYITTLSNEDRPSQEEVTPASVITLTLSAYVFNNANIIGPDNAGPNDKTLTAPFFTNDSRLEAAMQKAGQDTSYWSFEPLEIDLQHTDILKGLRSALIQCRNGDIVECYMTYNVAYGDSGFGMVPKQSPVAVFFTIDSVDGVNAGGEVSVSVDTGNGDDDGLGGHYHDFPADSDAINTNNR